MNSNVYKIKDICRKGLSKYTIKAYLSIPPIENPLILDIGCGTGVSTLALANECNGNIYAVDTDDACLSWLEEKVNASNYSNRITIMHASVFEFNIINKQFDIVLSEGLLNIIGFKKGLPVLMKYLKPNGFLIIHDELHDDMRKKILFKKFGLELLYSFVLDQNVWWNSYYCYMEDLINQDGRHSYFENELNEIAEFKKNPMKFKSIIYVLGK